MKKSFFLLFLVVFSNNLMAAGGDKGKEKDTGNPQNEGDKKRKFPDSPIKAPLSKKNKASSINSEERKQLLHELPPNPNVVLDTYHQEDDIFLEMLASEELTPNSDSARVILENNSDSIFLARRLNGDNIFHILLRRALNDPEFIEVIIQAINIDQHCQALTTANSNSQTPLALAKDYLRQQAYFGEIADLLFDKVRHEENQDEKYVNSHDNFDLSEDDGIRAPMEFETSQPLSFEEVNNADGHFFATERNIAKVLLHPDRLRAIDRVEALIMQGVDVTEPNDEGTTPLMIAARLGLRQLVDKFIANGADPCQVNNSGENTLLHLLANPKDLRDRSVFSHIHWEILNILLEREDAEQMVEAKSILGTALTLAAQIGKFKVFFSIFRVKPCLVLEKDKAGRTPLHTAMINGHKGIVSTLLSSVIKDIYEQDIHGKSSVDSAIEAGQLDVIKLVMEKTKLILNDKQYHNLLSQAVKQKNTNYVECLILGREPQASQAARQAIIKTAQLNNSENEARITQLLTLSDGLYNDANFLIKLARFIHPSDNNIIRYAQSNNAAAIKAAKVADFNASNAWGLTPVLIATILGHTSCVAALLSKGADTNILLENRSITNILSLMLEQGLLGLGGNHLFDLFERKKQLQAQGKIEDANEKRRMLREAALKRLEQNNQQ